MNSATWRRRIVARLSSQTRDNRQEIEVTKNPLHYSTARPHAVILSAIQRTTAKRFSPKVAYGKSQLQVLANLNSHAKYQSLSYCRRTFPATSKVKVSKPTCMRISSSANSRSDGGKLNWKTASAGCP